MTSHPHLGVDGLDRILQFKGYGNPKGDYWFIGIEEAGDSDPTENLRQHVIRSRFDDVEDLASAHSRDNLGVSMDLLIPTWATMSRIVLRLEGDPEWHDREAVRAYQSQRLGRKDSETFLTELLPLPKPSDSRWPDWWPFSKWTSWARYAEAVLPERLTTLRNLMRECSPRFVFWYGKWYWQNYRTDLFPGVEFSPIADGNLEVARLSQSTIVLTPFFSYYRMTTTLIDRMAKELGSSGTPRLSPRTPSEATATKHQL